jgi:hypothetical protein
MVNITLISIATDRYIDYWVDLVRSSYNKFAPDKKYNWILFTNKEKTIPKDIVQYFGDKLRIFHIEHKPWPYVTLDRYKYIYDIKEFITGDVIVYIDADMKFVANFDPLDQLDVKSGQDLAFVQHPGFYRASFKALPFSVINLVTQIKDLWDKLFVGGLGSWERRKISTAYVPYSKRKKYYIGAIWFGSRAKILEMCYELMQQIDIDGNKNVMAKWHDESHLNAYAVRNKHVIVNPSYCFVSSYKQLSDLKPIVEAVDKNLRSVWIR